MSSLNKATIIGNVGQDPDIKTMQSGDKVANLSIATSEKWKDKNTGETIEKTEWHRISVFNQGLVGVIEKYVNKGDKLYIEGQLQTRSYEKDGQKHYATEIVLKAYGGALIMLGNGKSGNQQSDHDQAKANGYQPDHQAPLDMDDSIPF